MRESIRRLSYDALIDVLSSLTLSRVPDENVIKALERNGIPFPSKYTYKDRDTLFKLLMRRSLTFLRIGQYELRIKSTLGPFSQSLLGFQKQKLNIIDDEIGVKPMGGEEMEDIVDKPNFEHGLGDEVKDVVSGLVGIVVCRNQWFNGCIQYCVQPQELKDGKPAERQWVDEGQLEEVTKGKVPTPMRKTAKEMFKEKFPLLEASPLDPAPELTKPTGGPHDTPTERVSNYAR